MDFLLLTFVLIDISRTFDVTLHTASLLILATFGVRWLGGMIFGNLSDRIGRKVPMLIALVWFTACAAFTGLSWSFSAVLVFRLLLGFGMAPILTLGSTMIAELWPEKYRAIGIGIVCTGWGFGSVLAAALYGLIYSALRLASALFVGVLTGLPHRSIHLSFCPRIASVAQGASSEESFHAVARRCSPYFANIAGW